MTLFGKILVLLNLALALMLAAWSFNIYTNGIDWTDHKDTKTTPPRMGQFAVRAAKLDELWKGAPPVQKDWLVLASRPDSASDRPSTENQAAKYAGRLEIMQVTHQFGILRIVIEREGHFFVGKWMGVNGEEARQVPLSYSQKSASQERREKNQTVRAGLGDVNGAGQKHFGDQKARILRMFVLGD